MKKFWVVILVIFLLFTSSLTQSKEVEEEKNVSKTQGKSVIFFGDSISYGALGSPKGYSWANYINDHYDFKECIISQEIQYCILG